MKPVMKALDAHTPSAGFKTVLKGTDAPRQKVRVDTDSVC